MNVATLPTLRDDLQLLPGPHALDGSPTWSIFDPLRNRYFRIGWRAFEIISRWAAVSPEDLLVRLEGEAAVPVQAGDISAISRFLIANSLTRNPFGGDSQNLARQHAARRTGWFKWLLRNYLFVRIPVWHPDRFLRATARWVEPAFSTTFCTIVCLLGVTGLYLAGQQWDQFVSTFSYFFDARGFVLFGLTIVVIKILHELGHAYTAHRYGCRVPTIGVAFLVLFPVLYTDTTNAWRLTSRRQRVHIAAAGIMVELAIASVATLLWALLPDGPARSVAFFAATTSWVMSLLVNLSPLLRFDGYYLLADVLGIENLQERSFEFGRWRLRKLLFGINRPPPELLSPELSRFLAVFAWVTWTYRFFLFLSIALLVYHLFFKALGLFLFVVEIVWFIALPIMREVSAWRALPRQEFSVSRLLVVSAIALLVLGGIFLPWQSQVRFPAILEHEVRAAVHSYESGMIAQIGVARGEEVRRGALVARIHSDELDAEFSKTRERIALAENRINRQAGSEMDRAEVNVLYEELEAAKSALAGLRARLERLTLRAPIDGTVIEMADSLHLGRWINRDLRIAVVSDQSVISIKGMVEETDAVDLNVGATAIFIPDDPLRPTLSATVIQVERQDAQRFDELYFASTFGGGIAVRQGRDGELEPESSVYTVRLSPRDTAPGISQVVRGVVRADSEPRSIFDRMFEQVAAVVVRESGF